MKAVRYLIREIWRATYDRLFRHADQRERRPSVLPVRLFEGDVYSEPCAFLPAEGLRSFWDALGVAEDAEERLQPEWVKGNLIPVAREFPVLSWLIQMHYDHAAISSVDIPELLREIAIGRRRCGAASGIAVFNELEKAGNLALLQGKSILISPF
jgi:hypothetical protein